MDLLIHRGLCILRQGELWTSEIQECSFCVCYILFWQVTNVPEV